ncbi:MAG: GAK system CofD-like protein [Desulfovibrio sp.]|nr:GAK system CofD-like protein [Desulfovibrio sp.]
MSRDVKQKPRLLFFSGGTALREFSRFLARTNPRTIHLITTFDSGGSTAELRRCFAIPAMGDIRNRLLALADTDAVSPSVFEFFQCRLSVNEESTRLLAFLRSLCSENHAFWDGATLSERRFLTSSLTYILGILPNDFDLRGASLGNLILTALYLQHGRDFVPALAFLHHFLRVQGTVLPIVDESLHLGCELLDGTSVLGQHRFKTLPCPIRSIFLTVHDPCRAAGTIDVCRPRLTKDAAGRLQEADLICYPMGSFYSSILVNLLVRAVPRTIAERNCPKIFIPNLGFDPETGNMPLLRQIEILLDIMHRDAPFCDNQDFLNAVLVDRSRGRYGTRIGSNDEALLREMGIRLFDLPLTRDGVCHDPVCTYEALNSLLWRWDGKGFSC